jgi:WD40 repeat protein/energy-coupling factor transporter ATP-binding protein EcfA2
MARYALVIGISEYQSPNLARLPKTVTDAEAVGQILKQYGDFQIVQRLPERWNVEKNDYEIGTKAVTGYELAQTLKKFLLEQAYRSDALIYFSGHGITFSDNLGQTKGYLATSDCVLETDGKRIVGQQHGIALDSFNELIRAAELSSLVLLLDCCHSGFFLERQLVEQTLSAFSSQKDYYVITACRSFEQAWAMHDEKHDVFTGAVLSGLAVENAGIDGNVSSDRLFDHISRQLKGKRQEPIRLGWGKSITIMNYPPTENTLSTTFTFNRENPYQGLQAFEIGKEKYFFGREQAIWALLERLNKGRFLSVIGRSGCGKSSLVKAGLLPKLQSDRLPGSSQWEIEIFTPGIDPLGKLTQILTRRHQENKPFVLFIDQFEEVFTLCNDEAKRQSFMRLMADEATASDRITRVIVAIRGDFLDRCAAYPEAANLINRTQPTTYVVEPLSRQEIEETIEKPAELHGVGFEPGLVSQIAEDVENQPGALPLLQYALSELWRKFCEQDSPSGQPLLTWKDYEEIGGVKGALDNRATILYRSFIPEDQAFVRRLFMTLVKLGDSNEVTRRRTTSDEVRAIADSPEQLQQVVTLLADQQQRLIITDENTIEVAHEALLSEWKLLCSWIEEDRDNIRLKQSLEDDCREWLERFNKSDDALLTGARLAAIEEWVNNTQPRLPHLEGEFLQKSVEKRDHKNKADLKRLEQQLEQEQKLRKAEKQKTLIAIVSGISLTTSLAALGFSQYQTLRATNIGQVKELAVLSETLFRTNNQLEALVASIKALNKIEMIQGGMPEALKELNSVISVVQERNRLLGHTRSVNGISFSSTKSLIASASSDQTVRIWKIDGTLKSLLKGHSDEIWRVSFSPDGQIVASASADATVKLWHVADGKEITTLEGHSMGARYVSFSPNIKDKLMVSSSDDGTIKIWKLDGSFPRLNIIKIKEFKKHNGRVWSINFSRDGQLIVSTDSKGIIKIWNIANGMEIATLKKHTKAVKFASFGRNNQTLVSVADDGKILLWDLISNSNNTKIINIKSRTIANDSKQAFTVKYSPNYQLIAASSDNGTVRLWRADGTPLPSIAGQNDRVNDLTFGPSSETVITAGRDGTVRIWNVANIATKEPKEQIKQACSWISDYIRNSLKSDNEIYNICDSMKERGK